VRETGSPFAQQTFITAHALPVFLDARAALRGNGVTE
jgi:hypothetical protein